MEGEETEGMNVVTQRRFGCLTSCGGCEVGDIWLQRGLETRHK